MNRRQASELKPGIYRLWWRNSYTPCLAVIGRLRDGRRWFATTKCTSVATMGVASEAWRLVRRVELVSVCDAREGTVLQ